MITLIILIILQLKSSSRIPACKSTSGWLPSSSSSFAGLRNRLWAHPPIRPCSSQTVDADERLTQELRKKQRSQVPLQTLSLNCIRKKQSGPYRCLCSAFAD
jgi:hypothetical protein